jgi:hypothetical protein
MMRPSRWPKPSVLLKRSLIFIHRWLGVALSVIFMLWFASGIVMMYWSFPDVSARDRRERAPMLNASQIKLSPEEAYAKLQLDQSAGGVQLTSFDGRPVYRFGGSAGGRAAGAVVEAAARRFMPTTAQSNRSR